MSRIGFAVVFAGICLAMSANAAEPALDEAHFLKAAEEALLKGDRGSAVQLYQSAIVYAPDDPIPYQRLGEFYAKSGEPELAQRYFSIALDVRPAYAPALQGLALLDIARGDRAGALAQHDVLLHACGASCPETAQVEKALNDGGIILDRAGRAP
jgi:Flp pilus assembly protein TadD